MTEEMSIPQAGQLIVGTDGKGEVVVNHPDLKPDENGVGHIVFSPQQAWDLAKILDKMASRAVRELPPLELNLKIETYDLSKRRKRKLKHKWTLLDPAYDPRVLKVAKRVCHEFGMPWTDPTTGITHPPPKRGKRGKQKTHSVQGVSKKKALRKPNRRRRRVD
jgi:hypothetical protein